jgi:hypothetical protein
MSGDGTIERVAEATIRDAVNITVYGNPVLDVVVQLGPFAINARAKRALEKIAAIHPDGAIEFKPDSFIVMYHQREEYVFGPLNPSGRLEVFRPGGKFPVPFCIGRESLVHAAPSHVTELVGPELRLGGGGANVLDGFFDVFAQLKVQFIATVERSEAEGRLDPFIKAITDVVGVFDPVKLYSYPGVNLAIEGLGLSNERTILVAQLPAEQPPAKLPRPRGKTIMVNTLYSPRVAVDALANSIAADRLAVLALTRSLCSTNTLPDSAIEFLREEHPRLFGDANSVRIDSVRDFVKRFVLPQAQCISIMNEDELAHITGVDLFVERGKTRVASLSGIIAALCSFRDLQAGRQDRIYVTAGRWGSFVLDERNHLIHCGIYNDPKGILHGTTAIGDTYATFVLALETIGNYIRPYVIPAEDVIRAAAGGADTCVYEGFGSFDVAKVNRYVEEPSRLVVDLGPIDTFPAEN